MFALNAWTHIGINFVVYADFAALILVPFEMVGNFKFMQRAMKVVPVYVVGGHRAWAMPSVFPLFAVHARLAHCFSLFGVDIVV